MQKTLPFITKPLVIQSVNYNVKNQRKVTYNIRKTPFLLVSTPNFATFEIGKTKGPFSSIRPTFAKLYAKLLRQNGRNNR